MSLPDFKTQIKNIRKEALELGFSISTMNEYQCIWNKFIKWKNEQHFTYDSNEYSKFLLEYYNFDVNTYTTKSKSRHQQLMRSKRILDNFDEYKKNMSKKMLPNQLYKDYPVLWNKYTEKYLYYCKNVRLNSDGTISVKKYYLIRLLSYFYQNGINELNKIVKEDVVRLINKTIDKGEISKRRYFYVLRDFLNYLFIENIQKEDLSIYVPKIKRQIRKKLPTYLKKEEIEKLLKSIPKTRKIDKRNNAIILIAARLGLRISDILNIKIKDIDWINKKINVIQPKTKHLNVLPLSKEIGWAIIDYIKNARPISNNEYLFLKHKYPFDKLEKFNSFNKYFEKADLETNKENKKGIHNLRHSLATNMLENDIPIEIIASTLGHSSTNTTNIYLKIDIKKLEECALEVDE